MSNSYLRIFLVISFLCFTLYGGDKTIDDVVDLSLEDLLNIQVVTASKQAQKASDAPAAIHVVTAAMIENRGYRNLEELLDDIPEIEIQKKAVSEYNNYISFRGISGNEKFIILMDGIRINSATGTPMAVGKNYSLANAQRVEVILGPASALYGVDAFTGIVNIITKRGDEVDGLKITANYGSFGSTENSIVFGKRIKDVSFVVTGQFYHSDEPFFPDIYTEEYAWYNDQYRNNGKVRLSPFLYDIILDTPIQPYETPSKAFFINARLNLKNFEIGFMHNMESHNDSVGGRPEFNIYAKNAIFKASVKSIYGKHQFTTDDGKWAFQSTISLNSYELSPDSEFLNTFTGYRDGYKYESNKTMKAEEQISYKLSKTSSIIAGFSYEDIAALPKTGDLPFAYDRDMSAQLQDLYYIGTNITDKDGKDLTIFQDFYNLEYKNYGAYAQFQTKLFKTAGLTLGGRYDYNTRYGASFNPRAGLVIPASKKLTIKLLYGEAFLAPSPYKAYQHYGAFISTNDPQSGEVTGLTGPFWHLPNPDLKPEKLRSIETNITYYLSEKIALSLDGYYTRIRDLITVEGNPAQTFRGIYVDFAERPVNKGEATAYGGTVRLDTLLKKGKLTVNGYAFYSLSDGDVDGEQLPHSAKHTVKAGVEMTYKKFSLFANLNYRSKSFHATLTDAMGNYLSNDAFTVVDMYAKYSGIIKSGKIKTAVFLKIDNLFDKKYYHVSLFGPEGFAAVPQDPVKVMGGVILEF